MLRVCSRSRLGRRLTRSHEKTKWKEKDPRTRDHSATNGKELKRIRMEILNRKTRSRKVIEDSTNGIRKQNTTIGITNEPRRIPPKTTIRNDAIEKTKRRTIVIDDRRLKEDGSDIRSRSIQKTRETILGT